MVHVEATELTTINISYQNRIQTLDLLRGIALCGILVMNISSFALPGTAYSNPMAFGSDSFSNHWIFIITHLFFDQKMMGLFSLLFGVSAILVIEKAIAKNQSPSRIYFSRMIWLILFGVAHGVLLWEGDILFYYGLCGLTLFFFRFLPNTVLFYLGFSCFIIAIFVGEYAQAWINNLSAGEQNYYSWAWQPNVEEIAYEIELRKADYLSLMYYRWQTSEIHAFANASPITLFFIAQGVLRALGMMLIGIALYRWQIFVSPHSTTFGKILLIGGLILAGYGIVAQYQQQWTMNYSMYHGRWFNHLATPFIVLAYVLLANQLFQYETLRYLKQAIMNVGRMAFSNYILQSLICTSLFYGYGLGWFAEYDRLELMAIVVVILIVQLLLSTVWLRFFQFGPLEWVWRVLTYFRFP